MEEGEKHERREEGEGDRAVAEIKSTREDERECGKAMKA